MQIYCNKNILSLMDYY